MLGLWGATTLVTAGMVGAGILILPSILAVFGSWSIVGWFLAAGMSYSIATIFGRLSRSFKGGAGPVYYIGETFGDNASFLASWGYFIAMTASSACSAIALGMYASPVFGLEGTLFTPALIGVLFLSIIFILNVLSGSSANTVLLVMTAIKVVAFLLMGIFGFKNIGSYSPNFGPTTDLFKSASIAMFAFLGIEFASLTKVKDPEKNVMKATKYGLFFATLVFLGVHCAVIFALPDAASSNRPVYDAAMVLFGNYGAVALGFVAVISCLSTLHGILLVQASTVENLSKKGWMPKMLSDLTKDGFAWKGGLAFVGIVIFAVLFAPDLAKKANHMATAMVAILYLACCFVDLKKHGLDVYNGLAIVSSLLILYNINLVMLAIIIGIYSAGLALKFLNTQCKK